EARAAAVDLFHAVEERLEFDAARTIRLDEDEHQRLPATQFLPRHFAAVLGESGEWGYASVPHRAGDGQLPGCDVVLLGEYRRRNRLSGLLRGLVQPQQPRPEEGQARNREVEARTHLVASFRGSHVDLDDDHADLRLVFGGRLLGLG